MTQSALEVVQTVKQSMAGGTDKWQGLLADDITFRGPVVTNVGKEDYIQGNKDFFPLVKGYTPVSEFGQGDKAAFEGVLTLSTPTGGTIDLKTVEIYEVKDGKIQNHKAYFDAEEFRKEFAPSE